MFSPKDVSDFLARYPSLRLAVAKVYGFRKFNPATHCYRIKANVDTTSDFHGKSFEVIFDAQVLQTPTRRRGIGRYAINFMISYCKSMPEVPFLAILTNVAQTFELEKAVAEFRKVSPENLKIHVIDAFQGASNLSFESAQQNLMATIVTAHSEKILIFDGFEKLTNRVPLSKAIGYSRIFILHDMIKLKFPESLLPSSYDKSLFSYLFREFSTADLVLSNSHTTADDWFAATGKVSPVILGASAFSKSELGNPLSARSGVLIVGAEQPHKNIERAVGSYLNLPDRLTDQHHLTIVGIRARGFQEYLVRKFENFLPKIIFANDISDEELAGLYRKNRLVVMPSLAEGLGLPLLEAWNFGTVAIGSVGTVAQEILQDPRLMFNPTNSNSITVTLKRYLSDDKAWTVQQQHLINRRENFSWDKTVASAKVAIGNLDV